MRATAARTLPSGAPRRAPGPERGAGDDAVTWRWREPGNRCELPKCGSAEGVQVHHLVAVSAGGSDRMDRLAVLCRRHHADVTAGRIALAPTRPVRVGSFAQR
jgi:hypothetical protein